MTAPLGPKFGYVDLLDHATYQNSVDEEAKAKSGERVNNTVRPSSAGKCTRELAYGLMEQTGQKYYEKDIREPNVSRLLTVGHAIEADLIMHFNKHTAEYFQVAYAQQSVLGFDLEVGKFADVLPKIIEGSLDWVFVSPDGKGLIDCKSKKDKFHRHFTSDWKATTDKLRNMETTVLIEDSDQAFWVEDIQAFLIELNDPFFEANFWQLNLYANTPWAKRKGIDHASIIQYNKNDSRLREIRFKPCEKLYERTKDKFQNAIDAAAKGKPKSAPRDFNYGSIKCAFCPYSSDCWSSKKLDAKQAYLDMNFPNKTWPKDSNKFTKKLAQTLETSYDTLKEYEGLGVNAKNAEAEILTIMIEANIKKIKFRDGRVYERKYLKSPRPHWELRRSKL